MTNKDRDYIKWQVPEYRIPNRPKAWYTTAMIVVVLLLFSCFFTFRNWVPIFLGYESNFLFALIIIIASAITIVNENRPPKIIDVVLDPEGLTLGSRFYDYDAFRNFAVVYKPKQSVKTLYLEFKNAVRPRLSIPLRSLDPLEIRNYILRYLDEDLERTEPPLSEQLTKRLKL